jgi:TonB family protein
VIPPVELNAAWTSIPLPDMPLDVVEHQGALWVCGSNESIARSTDGGRHWQLLARREHGQMLFTITFPDTATIAAFGTEGVRMVSHDGGARWTRSYVKPYRSLMQVEFATPTLAYAITDQGYGISHDGGASWKLHDATIVNGIGTQALAVRDAGHVALIRNNDDGDSQVLLTSDDGGRHFDEFKFSQGENWTTLRSTPDGYIAYGFRDKHKSVPVAAVFHDATGWQLLPDTNIEMDWCTLQGCLTDGGWAEFDGAKRGGRAVGTVGQVGAEGCEIHQVAARPRQTTRRGPDRAGACGVPGPVERQAGRVAKPLGVPRQSMTRTYQLPEDDDLPLLRAWAVSADTFCKAGETLRCRIGRTPYTPPAAQPMGNITQALKCVHCPDPAYPRQAVLAERTGRVFVKMMVSKTGEPYDVILLSTPSASLAEAAMAAVRQSRFRPLEIDDKPCSTEVEMKFYYRALQ